jgi:hypothetical protein
LLASNIPTSEHPERRDRQQKTDAELVAVEHESIRERRRVTPSLVAVSIGPSPGPSRLLIEFVRPTSCGSPATGPRPTPIPPWCRGAAVRCSGLSWTRQSRRPKAREVEAWIADAMGSVLLVTSAAE